MNALKNTINFTTLLLCLFIFTPIGNSQNSINWLNEGDNFFKQSNFQAALNSYNLYIENNPDDPRGYLHRARLNAVIGSTNASHLDFAVAENLNPLSHMYLDANLRFYYYAEKFFDYNNSETADPFSKSPLRMQDYLFFIDSMVIGHESDSLIIEIIEDVCDKNFIEVEDKLGRINNDESNLALIHDIKGLMKFKMGNLESAINHFTQAIEHAPSFAIAYHNRAICYKMMNQFDRAKDDLKKAISINNELPLFHFTFAKLNQKFDNFDIAKESYKKAIEIDNNYLEAYVNYSQLLKSIGDYDASLLYLSDLNLYNIKTSEQHYLKANLHFVYGEYEDAKYHFLKYLSNYQEDDDALYNLGLTKLLLREYSEGCNCISRSLERKENEKRMEIYDVYCSNNF